MFLMVLIFEIGLVLIFSFNMFVKFFIGLIVCKLLNLKLSDINVVKFVIGVKLFI